MNPLELREKREEYAVQIEQLRDLSEQEGRDWTSEDEQRWKNANADYDKLTRQIEVAERAEQIERDRGQLDERLDVATGPETRSRGGNGSPRQISEEDRSLGLQAWLCCNNDMQLRQDQIDACQRMGFNPNRAKFNFNLRDTNELRAAKRTWNSRNIEHAHDATLERLESRNLSAVVGSTGGFTVPEGFVNSLEVNMLAFGGMLQVADIVRTDQGNDLPWPTVDDTSNTGARLGESASIGSSVDPSFGAIVFKAIKYTSKLIKVPVELLEDSAIDMAAEVGRLLGERLGRISNTDFTTAAGGGLAPRGIMVASTLGVTAASTSAIAADEIFDLQHSVDPAYRSGARFMMHDLITAEIRKLKDGSGNYLWSSGLRDGVPDSLAGSPTTINQDMSSALTTGLKVLLFGQLSKYKIRQVRGVRFVRLDERYADNDQVGFIALLRQDGDLLDAGTAPVKYLQLA